MTPIELILGRHGYEILTGTDAYDLTDKNIAMVVIRENTVLAALDVDTVDILTTRPGIDGALTVTDSPILAGYGVGGRDTKLFTNIQLTSGSVSLFYAKPNTGE